MRFVVKKEIFEELPSACFGVVMAKGIDNNNAYPEIEQFLDESIQAAMQRFEGRKVKEDPDILPYREAFRALNINPNKYFCSIEALFTRIAKGKGVPHINPVVDLGNAISLKYTLPMGAHDLGKSSEDICIRLRFLYKGIIINHNKKPSQPTLKRRFFEKKAAFFSWPGLGKEWC